MWFFFYFIFLREKFWNSLKKKSNLNLILKILKWLWHTFIYLFIYLCLKTIELFLFFFFTPSFQGPFDREIALIFAHKNFKS